MPIDFVRLPDGRRLALDELGDPTGAPILYCHGTPDSRLARHPDDGIAAARGIRLLSVDRPGIGRSDPDPHATLSTVADDLLAVLDDRGIERAGVFAWSAGSLWALALAGHHPSRVERIVLAAPLVPHDAYADADVLRAAGPSRAMVAELDEPEDAAELAAWLLPETIDDGIAREMLADSLAALADVGGAAEQLVAAIRASVEQGLIGVERDLVAQATPLGATLDRIEAPVHVHVGSDDTVTPPAMACWLAERLDGTLTEHEGVGHELALRRWAGLLDELVP